MRRRGGNQIFREVEEKKLETREKQGANKSAINQERGRVLLWGINSAVDSRLNKRQPSEQNHRSIYIYMALALSVCLPASLLLQLSVVAGIRLRRQWSCALTNQFVGRPDICTGADRTGTHTAAPWLEISAPIFWLHASPVSNSGVCAVTPRGMQLMNLLQIN